ncbi:MAG TPA: histidine kinase [Chryseosolibacter sp.]
MERFWKYKLDHIIFWIATVGFHMLTRSHLIENAGVFHFLLDVIVRNGLLAIVVYLNIFVLIPKFAQQKRWGLYLVFIVLDIAFYVLAKNAHDIMLSNAIIHHTDEHFFFDNTFYNLSIALFYMAFAVALQLSREWYQQREHIRKIEVEKLNTELDYLKAQINPHFLFNSINTIYFQIDKHNATARETLSSFSEMLRYQLYECNGTDVDIEKEISYLKNYVDLQRHRKDDNYTITFDHANVHGFRIAPLLLIPFVENAFKHVSHFSSGNEINIRMHRENGSFLMSVRNTCDSSSQKTSLGGGIGLKNANRRLELLYPSRYKLDIKTEPKSFEVNLELKLN